MPAITAELSGFIFDQKAFSKAFDEAVLQMYKEGLKRFLRAALPSIPVKTSFVRGAFKIFEQFAGESEPSTGATRIAKKITEYTKRVETVRSKLEAIKFTTISEELARKTKLEGRLTKLQARLSELKATRRTGDIHIKGVLGALGARLKQGGEVDIERPQLKVSAQGKRGEALKVAKEANLKAARGYRKRVSIAVRRGERAPLNQLGTVEYYKHTDDSRTLKTPTSGQNFASMEYTANSGKYAIVLKIDITYFAINDEFSNRFTPSAPWKSFANGRRAMFDYIKGNLGKLPNVLSFMLETKYSLGKTGTVTKTEKRLVV